jgi:protein SEY1
MSGPVIQVVDSEGNFTESPEWFTEDAGLGADVISVVAVLGAQASGKSTLLNAALGTSFDVAPRNAVGTATTKGIAAAKSAASPTVLVLDIEGCDSRARGRAGKAFQARCASLAASLADVIVLNFWYHDVGRLDATGYVLLETVFNEAVKASADGGSFQSALVFAVRDVDDDIEEADLRKRLMSDAEELWQNFSSGAGLTDFFDVSTVSFPHLRHRPDAFQAAADSFGAQITNSGSPAYLCKPAYSKGIPADSCVVFARGIWDSFGVTSSPAGRDLAALAAEVDDDLLAEAGGEDSLVAAYRCNEAFSDALQASTARTADISTSLDEGEKVDALGSKMADIMADALQTYDDAVESYVDEPIYSRKRRELASILDTSLHGLFLKQIQLLRENALAHFKSATSSEDMPSDFAFFTADSLFSRSAEESKRPGSVWQYSSERTDLQNMMQEISTQRKRLLTSQVASAQQHANAMQFLQVQQAQVQAMQQQQYGGSAGQWNVGAAYRPPDTNINASLSYSGGRTAIQISMVPDESASLLGPGGFVNGLGPGNLGLSLNLNA